MAPRPMAWPDRAIEAEPGGCDRLKIRECLMRYCRALDCADSHVLASCYWPDGPAAAFVEQAVPALRAMRRALHKIGNVLIELDGEEARVESFVVAYHSLPDSLGGAEAVVGGRWIDRFEKRAGVWRIASRRFQLDWCRNVAPGEGWSEALYGLPAGMPAGAMAMRAAGSLSA
ncbi:MAG TPA: nuclear transport factor 2 family protein [Azospirillaceae bacterium]|nr:nuclear transport factor 2 family protein [Azospirillaceae bacterium]